MATKQEPSMQSSIKRAAADVREGNLEGLKEDVSLAAQQATKRVEKELGRFRRSLDKTTHQVTASARRHPGWTAGLCFGAGALLGAALFGALRPRPTGLQLFGRGFRDAWDTTRGSLASGFGSLRRAAR